MINKVSTADLSREEWLELRKKGIGGSDAGAVVGLNKYKSVFDVVADKLGFAPEQQDNERMRQGRDLEEYVAIRFTEATGKDVRRDNAIITNTDYPFALANIDRKVVGEKAGLECKTTTHLTYRRYLNGEFPEEYYVQCMHYLMVTGYDRWYLAVLVFGEELKVFTIERDEREIKALSEAEKAVWEQYVLKGKLPPAQGFDASDEIISNIVGTEENDKQADCTLYLDELKRLSEIKSRIKELKSEQTTIEQNIKLFMDDAAYGYADGYKISYKSSNRTKYDVDSYIKNELDNDSSVLEKYKKITKIRTLRITEEVNKEDE